MMFHILSVFIIPHFVQTVNAQNRLLGLKKRFSCTKCIFSMRLFSLNELFCTLFCNASKYLSLFLPNLSFSSSNHGIVGLTRPSMFLIILAFFLSVNLQNRLSKFKKTTPFVILPVFLKNPLFSKTVLYIICLYSDEGFLFGGKRIS